MRNIEYTKMAYLYDKFYSNKKYSKEVEFLTSLISRKDCEILDAGCGTGNHAKLLHELGYSVHGFDQSKEMVEIANSKINNCFYVANLLDLESEAKYDLIISFFAVFNHLKNYAQFKKALFNLKECLKEHGTIIIDLHNPQNSGEKTESIDGAIRIMKWKKCKLLSKEFTKITYIVDENKYVTKHTFKIFDINKLDKIAKKLGFLNVKFCENYDIESCASKYSKNIQMILSI